MISRLVDSEATRVSRRDLNPPGNLALVSHLYLALLSLAEESGLAWVESEGLSGSKGTLGPERSWTSPSGFRFK